jgi:DNA-binding response OmpR family regulator
MDKKKILIVDDEQDTLSVLEKGFAVEGYSVVTATSAKSLDAALMLTQPELPDLIILDLVLPDMDGREIVAKLKEKPGISNIPVLYLSGLFSKEQERQRNHMLGENVMFAKPYEMEELAAAVKNLLKGQKKILIVDDETDVLAVLEKGLSVEDYSVVKASDGSTALDMAKSEHPDLIILDLKMPDIYGGDVARMLNEDPETKNIPVMFLTGMFPKAGEPDGGRMIASHVLFAKPYEMTELVTTIKTLLQKKMSR